MLPDFPEFKPIVLEDRDSLENFFARKPARISEFTFANLFAWRRIDNYQAALYRDGVLFLKEFRGRFSMLPFGLEADAAPVVEEISAWFRSRGRPLLLESVDEKLAAQISGVPGIAVREDRDNFDYVYLAQELIDLKGEKFHDKKNLLNQFLRNHPGYQYRPLTAELVEKAVRFEHRWCEERDCEKVEGLSHEKCAVFQLLENFSALKTSGGMIEVDGRVVALTLGEPLNEETFVIHVEKAQGKIPGLYQAINRDFLANRAAGFKYVNREQDLGVPGLRKAKLSYNPAEMIKKYRVEENGGTG